MRIEKLNYGNVILYLGYLKKALNDEPDMMCIETVNEEEIIERVSSSNQSTSLLVFDDERVVGRLEYHFYSCIQDGYKMAYVNWVYVLRRYRNKGFAHALFAEFEKECRENDIDEYFLIQANNENATDFYNSFVSANIANEKILRKSLK